MAPTLEAVAPTLGTACPSLPPRGANPPWGGPAVDCVAPRKTCCVYLGQTWQTRLVGRLAQRHQGGGRRPGDSRSAECHASLVRDTAPLNPPRYTTRQIASKLGLSAAGLLPPRLPLRVLRCPPEGANPVLGRPGGGFLCPHARHCVSFAAPRGGEPRLGAARRRIPLSPRSALRVLRCPPRGRTPPWGGPAAGLFGQGA